MKKNTKRGSSWTALAALTLTIGLTLTGCGAPCTSHVRSAHCAGTWV